MKTYVECVRARIRFTWEGDLPHIPEGTQISLPGVAGTRATIVSVQLFDDGRVKQRIICAP